ncbi:energy transducer TonB [Pedobacter sp. UBA4863]|uniref:energy transducer TonB n=1 Tax=Pedobacter sp. UBA4863 TaxID=1947060 RepID=UPI0025FA09AD|nr:energy transducer TonB [Pedobacter sp. UBA4863]
MAQNHQEENNYPKALAISTLLMGAFIALSFLWIIGKFEPNEELGMGGMVVNYGTSVTGMGTDYTSMEEPSMAPDANGKKPDQITPDPSNKSVSTQLSDKNLATQDMDEAVSVNTKETKSNANPSNQESKAEQPAINQNAIYKGKKNNATGGGDGTGTTPGNQGDPDGDPLAPFYGDGGSGFGNKPLPLSNFRNLVKPDDDGQETGTIMVKIEVNKSGRIVRATAGARGSTFKNNVLEDKCERAMLNASLNAITKGPDIRIFYVPFKFIVK